MRAEDFEQIYLMDWVRLHKEIEPFMIHIRNEGKRSYKEGMKAVKMGLHRGVSDLFLAYPSQGKYGFWIELKRPKTAINKAGILNVYQTEFLEKMKSLNYQAGAYWGWQQAAMAICDYMKIKFK